MCAGQPAGSPQDDTVFRVALLKHLSSGVGHVLAAHHVVGRGAACQLRLAQPQVSGLHAELTWDGDRWMVQDLGSRNGTFVDGTRLAAGERKAIGRGSLLAFGDVEDRYTLAEIEPPRLMAMGNEGPAVLADSNLLCLPSTENPEVTVFEDATGRWVLESGESTKVIADRESVVVGGVSWTIYLPTASDQTRDAESRPLPLDAISLDFFVSRDGEYVAVRLSHEHGKVDIEPRAHAQLLLALARIRLADREREHLKDSEHGWIHREDLVRDLGIDLQLLNLWVYRARQQLVKAGIRDAGNIVERRSGTLQLRIGVSKLAVHGA